MAKKRRSIAVERDPVPAHEPVPKAAPPPSSPSLRVRPAEWRTLGIVLGIAAVAYVNALGGAFLYDDNFQILKNPTLADLGNIPRMFTQGVWQFMNASADAPVGSYYRPLFNIALIVENHLFGTDPHGWHLVSVVLHLGVTAGVYALARRWGLSNEVAAAAAVLFGLHPTHVESVAWASGLPDPLAALALLGALLLYERWRAAPARGSWPLVASVALALVATFAKETAIVFPAFVGARELFDAGGESFGARLRRSIVRAAPFGAAVAVYLAMRVAVLGFLTKIEPKAIGVTTTQVLLTIPSTIVHYVKVLLVPVPLAITYDLTYVSSPADPRFWASAVSVVALVGAAVIFGGRSTVARRALLWLGLFVLPVLNLKAFNPQESLVHDRYLYIPSIGFCLLAAMGIAWLAERFAARRERVFWGVVTALAVFSFALTVFQNETWSDDLAMANQALAHDPDRPFLHNYVGAYYVNAGNASEAERWYLQAVDRQPDFYDALSNLGDVCRMQNRTSEAEVYYSRAVDAGAPYANTAKNLGSARIALGRLDDAVAPLERAREIDPNDADAVFSLAWIADQKGDGARAEQLYADALRLRPSYPEPRINLAVLQIKAGRTKEAIDNLEYAKKIVPSHPIMQYWLGEAYRVAGRPQDALPLLTQVASAQPQHPLVHTSLGLAYEALGNVASARASFADAIRVAPNEPTTATARDHLARLGG